MRVCEIRDRRRLMDAALGRIACDLTVENVRFANMLTGEIYPAQVDVLDGAVVRVREAGESLPVPSHSVSDGGGRDLLPGLIDAHMHVESTMMIPQQLARAIVPWGTTTVCTDPHEIANVMGKRGVRFMLENAGLAALRQYILAPSCVPAAPGLESAGASFCAGDVGELLGQPGVIGVAEMMDYMGVVNGADRMAAIAEEGRGRGMFLQGHAPQLTGAALAAYRIGGPSSDHESRSAEEIREKLRNGMRINLRASSIVDALEELTRGLEGMGWLDQVSLCTDDVHAADLLAKGHLNAIVARLIHGGMNPMVAYKLCTYNAAREYGFDDLGAVAPGYLADFQLLDALDGRMPYAVFLRGKLAACQGRYVLQDQSSTCRVQPENTMRVCGTKGEEDFCIAVGDGRQTARVLVLGRTGRGLERSGEWVALPVRNGLVSLQDRPDLQFIAVVNRYGSGAKTVAVTKDFGLREGAVATTISHDSHNFTVVYRDAKSAFACLEKLRETGGGICAAREGRCIEALPLPLAGLMSLDACDVLAKKIDAVQSAMQSLCSKPFSLLDISVYALPAVPGLVITDKGIVDGDRQAFIASVS